MGVPKKNSMSSVGLLSKCEDKGKIRGCSRHMIGDRKYFLTFKNKDEGLVTFGNNDKGKLRGKATIGKLNSVRI